MRERNQIEKLFLDFMLPVCLLVSFFMLIFIIRVPENTGPLDDNSSSEPIHENNFANRPYLFEDKHTLPVISITMDPKDLWDPDIGIYVKGNESTGVSNYANKGEEWERSAIIDFYEEDGNFAFRVPVGIRIHGGKTRSGSQKSLKITPKRQFGSITLDYPIFPTQPYTRYNGLILRSSGNDRRKTLFRDPLAQSLVIGMVDTQAYRPSIVYINREYWGIHNIREFYDERYFQNHHGAKKGKVVVVEPNQDNIESPGYPEVTVGEKGDEQSYVDLMSFLETHDLSDEKNYQYVKDVIDVDNYRDYILAQIYWGNNDFLNHNVKLWRSKNSDINDKGKNGTLDGRWRWLLYDTDFAFGFKKDASKDLLDELMRPDFHDKEWTNRILRSLLKNQKFRISFINRYADLLNTSFFTDTVLESVDMFEERLEPEIPMHVKFWITKPESSGDPLPASLEEWKANVEEIREFVNVRADTSRGHFVENFDLSGVSQISLKITSAEGGSVIINTATYSETTQNPIYFQGVPVPIKADANDGYKFVRWEGDVPSDMTEQEEIVLTFSKESINLKAIFEKVPEKK